MQKKFRALRIVALIYKVIAWILLIGGIVGALMTVVIGAIQGRVGQVSPMMGRVPLLGRTEGLWVGIVTGVLVLLAALVQFVLLYAASEVIDLALAIEQNTRETAYFLRGENVVPPPPSWTGAPSAQS
jgi:hypothetical protein